MINELKVKLTALGMSEEMATKAIATVGEFGKSKLPNAVHPAIDDVLAGKKPDLSQLSSLVSSFKGFFGK